MLEKADLHLPSWRTFDWWFWLKKDLRAGFPKGGRPPDFATSHCTWREVPPRDGGGVLPRRRVHRRGLALRDRFPVRRHFFSRFIPGVEDFFWFQFQLRISARAAAVASTGKGRNRIPCESFDGISPVARRTTGFVL